MKILVHDYAGHTFSLQLSWYLAEKGPGRVVGKSSFLSIYKRCHQLNGYQYTRRVYGCADFEGCPVKSDCTRSKYNRGLNIGGNEENGPVTAHFS